MEYAAELAPELVASSLASWFSNKPASFVYGFFV